MDKKELETLPFEELLEKMEEVAKALESEDASLEKSMELFQKGMLLSKICSDKLENVEKQVQTLLEENNEIVTKDIDFENPEK